jgi:predicted nucleotidyltransferase
MPAWDAVLGRALESQPDVRLAVLFGSTARATPRGDSDLDVGVLGLSTAMLRALQLTLERATGRTVDVIALETAPPLLRFEIARDGRVLAERTPHLWSDFKARAMVDWWDWAPLARRFHQAAAARLRAEVSRGPA